MTWKYNKATKKGIEPIIIQGIVILNKLHFNIGKNGNNENVNPEEHRWVDLPSLNPVSLAFKHIFIRNQKSL